MTTKRRRRIGAISTRGGKCKRTCASWKKVAGGMLRCKKFRPVTPAECQLQRGREAAKGRTRSGR